MLSRGSAALNHRGSGAGLLSQGGSWAGLLAFSRIAEAAPICDDAVPTLLCVVRGSEPGSRTQRFLEGKAFGESPTVRGACWVVRANFYQSAQQSRKTYFFASCPPADTLPQMSIPAAATAAIPPATCGWRHQTSPLSSSMDSSFSLHPGPIVRIDNRCSARHRRRRCCRYLVCFLLFGLLLLRLLMYLCSGPPPPGVPRGI